MLAFCVRRAGQKGRVRFLGKFRVFVMAFVEAEDKFDWGEGGFD